MSSDLLRLIPGDPTYVPPPDAVARARKLLRQQLPTAGTITSQSTEDVRFVDQGENFESVLCEFCGSELAPEWWQSAMDRAYETQFKDLSTLLPCCGRVGSLNTLNYQGPAGFARFTLEVEEPNISQNLPEKDIELLEMCLGTRLRQIRARY